MQITLKISNTPTSANKLHRYGKGAGSRTAEYKAWHDAALWEIKAKKLPRMPLCYWSSSIRIPASANSFDLDNMVKPIHDLLGESKVSPDDRYLVKFDVEYWDNDHVLVTIRSEELSVWAKILRTSKYVLGKLRKAENG